MRIWVTGLGLVSPLGHDAETTRAALLDGRTGFSGVTLFDPTGCRSEIAAEIADLDVAAIAPGGEAARWSRTDAMAVVAAREALADYEGSAPDLIVGGTTAGMFETEDLLAELHRDPTAQMSLEAMLSHPLSATVDRMRSAVRPFARARTICSACSSGANALLLGASWLRTGASRRVLAGGADGLCRLTYVGFSCLGALSPEPCRPFDAARKGLTLGEGAAFLLLETEEAARERGATPIAELRGWAVGAEAHHITNPQASGETAASVMSSALARAGLAPSDIDYINAHGTATKLNDKMESAAIQRAFGGEVERISVSSTKSMIGHTLGAAGAIEAAICALAIRDGEVPPTASLTDVDPDCALNHVRTRQTQRVRAAMSNSFGFGGSDASVVLVAPDAFAAPVAPPQRRVMVSAAATLGPDGLVDHHDTSRHLEPGPEPAAGHITFEAKEHLDLGRARRIDRAGRFAATVMGAAIGAASLDVEGSERAGAILGAAYGSVDACSAFIDRVYDKGAKFASPAVFPNLLPSSPVAHASIYHRLKGPVFSSADLDATGVGAMVTAAELIAAGVADTMLAGGVEEMSRITEAVLGPLCSAERQSAGERSEGSAVVVFEAAETCAAPIAELTWARSWRGPAGSALASAPKPAARALVVTGHQTPALELMLADTPWAHTPTRSAAPRVGTHECASGFAAAGAVGALASGAVDSVLVLGIAPDRGYAFVMTRT